MTFPNDTANKASSADFLSPPGSKYRMIWFQYPTSPRPWSTAALLSLIRHHWESAMHPTCPLAGLLLPLHVGPLPPTSLPGKMSLVLQDPTCPRSYVTSRTPSTSPDRVAATDYTWQVILSCPPLILLSCTFKFLSFLKYCTFLKIVFISRLHYLTPRRCLIHLYEWVCCMNEGMNDPAICILFCP